MRENNLAKDEHNMNVFTYSGRYWSSRGRDYKGFREPNNFNEIHSLFQMKKVFLKKIVIAEN
jgi:hypothetical protein